jgi:hypothetical protein
VQPPRSRLTDGGSAKELEVSREGAITRFMDKEQSKKYMESAYQFGDLVFKALTEIGKGTRFHRLLVV